MAEWSIILGRSYEGRLVGSRRSIKGMSSKPIHRCHALRIAGLVLVLASLIVLPGCWVMSINPLYEDVTPKDRDIVFEKDLAGSWSIKDGKCTVVLTLTPMDDFYDLRYVEGEECNDPDKQIHQQARLVKLDTYYFLDISPMPDDVCEMCMALHWIFLAKFDKDILALTPIDFEGLKKLMQTASVHLKRLPDSSKPRIFDDPMRLTSSSKELKDFCKGFAGDKRVFNPELTVVFKRL
jgi:hypothetical protein